MFYFSHIPLPVLNCPPFRRFSGKEVDCITGAPFQMILSNFNAFSFHIHMTFTAIFHAISALFSFLSSSHFHRFLKRRKDFLCFMIGGKQEIQPSIIMPRLINIDLVSWTQAGFIRGRSCANNLWILRRVAERSIEFKVPVYCALVDYKGAFDALNRTTLGRVLNLFLSPSMVKRVLTLYFDAKAKVTLDSSVGPEFNLQRGVRQGCPASPSFFTVALSFISWSFRLTYEGIKLVTLHLSTLEYADDQILFTLTAGGMQSMLDFIVNNAEPFGLRLSPKKCELICFHCPGTINRNNLPRVSVGDRVLPWKQSVVYLGSRIAEDGNTLVAVKHRICCAETVIKRLDKRVFSRRNIDAKLKGHFIDSAVFASLLYGLEHCAFGTRDQRCLDGFFLGLAKRVLHLPFDYHLSYVEAEQSLGVTRPSARLRRERLRWTGHMLRSEDTVLYEALIFIPDGGARGRGRPRRRYYDTIKADLAERNVILDHRGQEQFWAKLALRASDRQAWNKTVVNGER